MPRCKRRGGGGGGGCGIVRWKACSDDEDKKELAEAEGAEAAEGRRAESGRVGRRRCETAAAAAATAAEVDDDEATFQSVAASATDDECWCRLGGWRCSGVGSSPLLRVEEGKRDAAEQGRPSLGACGCGCIASPPHLVDSAWPRHHFFLLLFYASDNVGMHSSGRDLNSEI